MQQIVAVSNAIMNPNNPKGRSTMKTSILVAAIMAGALAAPFATAQDKSLSSPAASAQKRSAPARQALRMDMDKQMSQMQENMKTMQQQMEKLRATTDPQERQKLMQEHMQTMQENMQAMRAMGGPMMMGSAGAKGSHKHTAHGNMTQRQEMMERRMDMMQMMMEQMMQQEQAMQSMPAK
jgi:hypothetical protein